MPPQDPQESEKPLPSFDDRAPKDRYCDLILTGGVTSAIAYPAVAFGLGQVYRLNAIGGASSGAGIAAVAAAAEYRRRHGSTDGFQTMAERTLELATEYGRYTNLSRLFHPLYAHRRLFNAIRRTVALPRCRKWHFAVDTACAYRWVLLLGFILGWVLVKEADAFSAQGWIAFTFVPPLTALVLLVLALSDDVLALAKDDFGLCDGLTQEREESHPPLTVWLHSLIQNAAGRADYDPPLSFADLHLAPGSPRETRGDLSEGGRESIRLEMVTANVTVGEPVRFPRSPGMTPLYFRPAEMRRLFPETVVEHMCMHSSLYGGDLDVIEPDGSKNKASDDATDERALWLLPLDDLPVVVAARMSVSFPVLFTAVPLWREDTERNTNLRRMRRCLMMDGGICSNFPIHLFDSLIPAWPTFGVSLYDLPTNDKRREATEYVDLPDMYSKGASPLWNGFNEDASCLDRTFGLVGALLTTTKDWSDSTLMRMPGVRDRVVRVGLLPGIGGLNFLMSRTDILSLVDQGTEAVRQLLKRYSQATTVTGQAAGWDEHRWIRFNLLCNSLTRGLGGLTQSAESSRYATSLRDLIERSKEEPPLCEQADETANAVPKNGKAKGSPLRADQAAALESALAALIQAEHILTATRIEQPYQPRPLPEVRVRPPM